MGNASRITGWTVVLGALLTMAVGCSSTRGGVGVEWGGGGHPREAGPAYKGGPPPHAPAHGYRAKHCYRYYPAKDVYYDTGRRIYFYIEGELWKSGASLPYHLQAGLGVYETVELDDDTPYAYHAGKKGAPARKVPPGQAKKMGPWGKVK